MMEHLRFLPSYLTLRSLSSFLYACEFYTCFKCVDHSFLASLMPNSLFRLSFAVILFSQTPSVCDSPSCAAVLFNLLPRNLLIWPIFPPHRCYLTVTLEANALPSLNFQQVLVSFSFAFIAHSAAVDRTRRSLFLCPKISPL